MNNRLLDERLAAFSAWCRENAGRTRQEESAREKLSRQVRSYTEQRLRTMSEKAFFDLLSPLWAMLMWGNKRYQVDNIIEANGMPLLRTQFANLLYGTQSIDKRWDEFRSKIKGVGPAIMSELLCKMYPDEYLLWNRKTYTGFRALEIADIPRYEARLDGKTYARLNRTGHDLLTHARKTHAAVVSDMLALNVFIWQELQIESSVETETTPSQEEALPENKKEAAFIHNDIRDKIAEIGRFLGFHAEVEKRVATGAVVDATWEVTIGNMGRVIYVFEVQTSGSIDSLLLNLMKAKNNKAVQGIIAVTDRQQIEKIRREAEALAIRDEIKYWDYITVLKVHESLQFVNESINNLDLVPAGL